jgi:hypothetical protein
VGVDALELVGVVVLVVELVEPLQLAMASIATKDSMTRNRRDVIKVRMSPLLNGVRGGRASVAARQGCAPG